MTRRLLSSTLALFLTTVALSKCPVAFAQDATGDEDSIREVVLRYQIKSWELNADVYFVEINSKDPSKEFLNRMADLKKPVKRKSDSKQAGAAKEYVRDKRSRLRGVIFDQARVIKKTESTVDVEGGYFCGSLCMASGTYHLQLRGTTWVVTGFDVSIIS